MSALRPELGVPLQIDTNDPLPFYHELRGLRSEAWANVMSIAETGPPQNPGMEARVARLEEDVRDIKATLWRLEPAIAELTAQMPHLSTKIDIERARGELLAGLESKPSRGAMWSMGGALFALSLGAMAAGAVLLPIPMKSWHVG